MSEMIERVALAISGSDDPANVLSIHRSRARLAIEAMREPTAEMIEAGGQAVWEEESKGVRAGTVKDWPKDDASSAWRAMIDEALK